VEHGSLTRESIDDILHYSRYAEVVYIPSDVGLIFAKDNIFHHNANNALFMAPYMIVYDNEYDTIVIAIRGTNSAVDILTDLKFDETEISLPELSNADGVRFWAHAGMLQTAQNILNELTSLNVLDPLLKDEQSNYYDCGLVITGHSLGAVSELFVTKSICKITITLSI
jgi:hypothetical protein